MHEDLPKRIVERLEKRRTEMLELSFVIRKMFALERSALLARLLSFPPLKEAVS